MRYHRGMGKLIMVSNRLPVGVSPDGEMARTTGGLASALEGVKGNGNQVWVGWPGGVLEDFSDPQGAIDSLDEMGFRPVFLTRAELDGFYEGYSNSSLWPVLHSMVARARFSRDWWNTYHEVNRRFAEVVLDCAEDGDSVWIHDYHLLPLPGMLRAAGKRLKIGFFLHTPFPTSEVFRALPHRTALLEGLLGADLLGFHTYDYLRHFRSSLLRVLGVESEMERLWVDGREVRMGVHPIGHNHPGIEEVMTTPGFPELLAAHRGNLAEKRIILNVERLDYTKGVPEKLAAMRSFLQEHPDKRNEVLFVLIAVPSRQGVGEYDVLTEHVQREVGAINGEFGTIGHAPIQFLHRGFPLADLAAFYALAEVCLVTPLRDGMNLVAKEFLDCQRRDSGARPGVLILSEFAGAAQELSLALQVNPYDVDKVAEAVNQALEMSDIERWKRIDGMQGRLRKQHSGVWAERFLAELDAMPPAEVRVEVSAMLPTARKLADDVAAGRRVALFLDYDGTLRDFVDVPDDAVPDLNLPPLLSELAAFSGMSVALVSGRPPAFLEKHFGGLGVTLVAEHGYRWLDHGKGEWELFNPHVTTDWKAAVREHLEQASLLTPGTHVEEKQSALVWHYRKADPEFGLWRARSLLDELTMMAANLPVTVHHGQKIVEISSLQVSKGMAVDHLIRSWEIHVALAAGDDQTDETMISLEPPAVEFIGVKVGKGSTRANRRTDQAGIRTFLVDLARMLRSQQFSQNSPS